MTYTLFKSYTSETLIRGTEAANVTLNFLFVANLSVIASYIQNDHKNNHSNN